MNATRLRVIWRTIRLPALLTATYLALSLALATLSARHGFGSPDGLGPAYVITTVTTVFVRIVLLVVVPAVLLYRVLMWIVERLLRRPGAHTCFEDSGDR